jgi:hypothetical protein
MAKAKPIVADAKRITPSKFAKLVAEECRINGIRATARRCNMPHTSLVKMVNNPGSIRHDVMDALASKLGFSLSLTKAPA